MSVLILPDGGRGTGPNPDGFDYPFLDPSPDVLHLLADFSLGYQVFNSTLSDYAQPLQIVWLSGFDTQFNYPTPGSSGTPPAGKGYTPTNAADLVVWDFDGNTVFDSTMGQYHGAPLGDRLYIHEWVTDKAICRAIQHIAFPSLNDVVVFPPEIWPVSGFLDRRTVARRPNDVTSIAVGVADLFLAPWARPLEGLQSLNGFPASGVTAPMTGQLQITAGYNIQFDVGKTTTRGLRQVTPITISAIPGAGSGFAPAVDTTPAIRQINGLTADARGNVNLSGTDCYALRQPAEIVSYAPRLTKLTPATLVWTNDCDICCACADYTNTARAVIALWNQFAAISNNATAVRDDYSTARARWMSAKACRESRWLTLSMLAHELQYVEIEATFTNHYETCLERLALSMIITTTPTTAYAVAEGTTFQSDGLGNVTAATLTPTATGYKAFWFTVPPQSQVSVRFRLIIGSLPCALVVTLKGESDGLYVPGSDEQSLGLDTE